MGKPSHDHSKIRSLDSFETEHEIENNIPTFTAPLIQWKDEVSTWYEYGKELPGRNASILSLCSKERQKFAHLMNPEMIHRYRSLADSIYQKELRLFNQNNNKNSSADERWVENTMSKGTLKDRIAAMSVTFSTDPIHKLYALDGLLGMCGCSSEGSKSNSRVAQLASAALEDLFINSLLPPDRKLLTLAQRPLYMYDKNQAERPQSGVQRKWKAATSIITLSPRILLLWRFEEIIKEKYALYLHRYMTQTLQVGAEQQKLSILQSAANLLSSMPEGETKLLSILVNKLGDPDKKTAAAAGHHLRIVLQRHPNMQTVIAREVQQLAHRSHLAPRALYNCVVFLNQLQLRRQDKNSSNTKREEESDRKLVSDSSLLASSLIKTYFRLFEVAVEKKSEKRKASSSDDATSLKSRLLSALLTGVNRAHPYLSEQYRDMEEHIDALYRIVHTASPTACTQALMLLFHLAVGLQIENQSDNDSDSDHCTGSREELDVKVYHERMRQKDRFYRALYATLETNGMLSGGKHLTMYYNLLYKALKYDSNQNRIHAFSKRLLAAVMHTPPPSTASALFLLQEISRTHQCLSHAWENVPDPESNGLLFLDDTKREPKAGIVSTAKIDEIDPVHTTAKENLIETAVPPCWEISLLSHHFHPSVKKFANDIGEIDYTGDPLQDFGMGSFLDKFAYRNPKSRDKFLQSIGRDKTKLSSRRLNRLQAQLELPVNDPSFLERTDISEQDFFFHRYFTERERRNKLKGMSRHGDREHENQDRERDGDEIDEIDGSWNAAQEEVFDAAEMAGLESGGKPFEEYEAMWETDEEEEAFVDRLALQLIEDAAGDPVDIDDDSGIDETEVVKDENPNEFEGDMDAFMEDSNSKEDFSYGSSSTSLNVTETEIVTGLNAGFDDEGSHDTLIIDKALGNTLAEESSDEDFIEDGKRMYASEVQKQRKYLKKNDFSTTFADAEEYEHMIETSSANLKRSALVAVSQKQDRVELQKSQSYAKKQKKH